MTERLGYQRVCNLLETMHSAELSGWIAYLHLDDEVQARRLARAITLAFRVDSRQPAENEEEVIDTTRPDFATKFKGFVNTPKGGKPPQGFLNRGTEIRMG